jgi:hypothetical protein
MTSLDFALLVVVVLVILAAKIIQLGLRGG